MGGEIAAYKASGQSVSEWCMSQGIGSRQGASVEEPKSCLTIHVGQATIEVESGLDRVSLEDVVQTLAML